MHFIKICTLRCIKLELLIGELLMFFFFFKDSYIAIIGDIKKSKKLNTILSLLAVVKYNWTDRQREIIWDMMKHQDSQAKSAERLRVAQSTIQRSLINGNYYAYKDAIDTIGNLLKEIRKDV